MTSRLASVRHSDRLKSQGLPAELVVVRSSDQPGAKPFCSETGTTLGGEYISQMPPLLSKA